MQKIIVIADVQANVLALESLYKYIKQQGADLLVNLGDIVSIGPFPNDTVELMRNIESSGVCVVNIMGNHDEIVIRPLDELQRVYHYSEEILKHETWTLSQLSGDNRKYIETFKKDFTFDGCYFSHYPRQINGEFKFFVPSDRHLNPSRGPTDIQLDSIYRETVFSPKIKYLFCGHDHFGFEVYSEKSKRYFYNPGSFGVNNFGQAPFYVVKIRGLQVHVAKEFVEYDLEMIHIALEKYKVPERDFIKKAFFKSLKS